jgi:hypothetical protein
LGITTNAGALCLGYGLLVGGGLFLLLLVGTQAARSPAEAILAILLGVIAPVPTLLVGVGLRRGWKIAPALCVLVPVVLAVVVAQVWGRPEPPRTAGLLTSAVFNLEYSQLYFLPGTILGLIAMAHAGLRRHRRG